MSASRGPAHSASKVSPVSRTHRLTTLKKSQSACAVRRALHRIVAVGGLFVLLAGQIAVSAHDETEHVVCPEHGDSFHAETHTSHSAPGFNPRSEGTQHEVHCGGITVAPVEASASRTSFAEAVRPLVIGAAPSELAFNAIALLHLAPKSSPPA